MPGFKNLKKANQRARNWSIFYHVWHFFCFAGAVTFVILAAFIWKSETDTVGKFNLKVTHNVCITFFFGSGIILVNILVGILALYMPQRPSLWILFCIVLAINSVVVMIPSILAIATSTELANPDPDERYPVKMRGSMENFDGKTANSKWTQLQSTYKCCGTINYKDWQDVKFGRTSLRVPQSCCLPHLEKQDPENCGLNILPHDDNANKRIYDEGCFKPAMKSVMIYLQIIGIVGIGFSGVYLVVALLSCFLVVTKKI